MLFILSAFKAVLVVWTIFIEGNFLRSLYRAFISVKNRNEINDALIIRARNLLFLGAMADWIGAMAIYVKEGMEYGSSTEYPMGLLLFTGTFFLIITVISRCFAIAAIWSRDVQGGPSVHVFKNLIITSTIFAMMLLLSARLIS